MSMPVFVIKAKDRLALETVGYYAMLCRWAGLPEQAAEVDKARAEMRAWRAAHPDQVKDPDHLHVPTQDVDTTEET
jgi:hypothetical protein